MKDKWIKIALTGLAAVTILSPISVINSKLAEAAAMQPSLDSQIVRLNPTAVLNIREAQFLMQDKGKVLAFTATITNSGTKELSLMDYWIKVKSKSGKIFKATQIESDKIKTTVTAKTSVNLTYYAVVDSQTTIGDLLFNVVKWDFSVSGYERSLGTIKAPSKSTGKAPAFTGKVMLYNNSKLRGAIKQVFVTKDQTNTFFTISYLVENVGFQATDLSKLSFFVQTDSQSVYNVNSSMAQISVEPKERKIVTLQASIPNSVAGKPLSLIAATLDETSKVQLPIGGFALPAAKAAVPTAAEANRQVFLLGQAVNTKTSIANADQNGIESNLSMDFTLKNMGTTALNITNLEFYAETEQGVQYPLSYAKEENATLLPQLEKSLALSGSIPTASLAKAKIILKTTATEKDKGYMIGIYQLQTAAQQGNVGGSYVNKDYQVKLNAVQRMPADDHDVLIADLIITNPTAAAVKIPSLTGYFTVNGVKLDSPSTVASLDQSLILAPNDFYNIVVYSKIPYTTAINNVSFALAQYADQKIGKTLYRFGGAPVNDAALYTRDKPYEIMNVGRRAVTTIEKSAIFEGQENSYFYSELEMVNQETRPAALTQLGGYLKDSNETIVPITLTKADAKIAANGKVLLRAAGKLPAGFNTQNYKLYLGQTITSSVGQQPGSETPVTESLVVKAVSYKLTPNLAKNTSLKEISVGNYKFGMDSILAGIRMKDSFSYDGVSVDFRYTLQKNDAAQIVPGEQKVYIELVDQGPAKTTYGKEFSLKPVEGTSTTTVEVLSEGTDILKSITFTDPDLIKKIQSFNKYVLNVYAVVGDLRVPIAAQELVWLKSSGN